MEFLTINHWLCRRIKDGLLLVLLVNLLCYCRGAVEIAKADESADTLNQDVEDVVRFFRARGIGVPKTVEKFAKYRGFMSDEDFQRLGRQHLIWLKRQRSRVSNLSFPPQNVVKVAPNLNQQLPQLSATTSSPHQKKVQSLNVGGVRNEESPNIETVKRKEYVSSEDHYAGKAPPEGPQVAPKEDSVMLFDTAFGFADHPNNEFHIWRAPFPSFGQPWPRPAIILSSEENFYRLDRTRLSFRTSAQSNYILLTAFTRTREVLGELLAASYYPRQWAHQESNVAHQVRGSLHTVEIHVKRQGRAWPHLHMDESYRLSVDSSGVHIHANETWGALRGLETFSQLVWQTKDNAFYINKTTIQDYPRFKHRGLLFDTARHFVRKEIILKNLDAMSYNKMNVFHWHIVDDQSFPFQSQTYPNLSSQGAYDRTHMVYSPDDVREILEYARERGIRVIPEFDSPGHTYSWGKGYPHLLTKCYDRDTWSGFYGPLNPARRSTFEFLSKFFEEIVEVFHDDYIHLGADEVGTKCWESNPEVIQLMSRFGLDRMELVTDYYLRRLQNLITRIGLRSKSKKRGFIVWQEARDSGVLLKSGTIVQVWKGDSPLDAHTVARTGQRVLYSACWYLDRQEYGAQWIKYYQCDPGAGLWQFWMECFSDHSSRLPLVVDHIDHRDKPYTFIHQLVLGERADLTSNLLDTVSESHEPWHDNILGGEACMWSEYQTDDTILQRIWPLTSAVAERLWSPVSANNIEKAGPRLEEHRCLLLMRGIPAGVVSGPGTCAYHNVTPASSPLKFRARNIRNHVNEAGRRPGISIMRVDNDGYMVPGYEHYQLSTLLLILFPVLAVLLAVIAMRHKALSVLPGHIEGPSSSPLRLLARLMTLRRIVASLGAFVLLYVAVWLLPILVFPGGGQRRSLDPQHNYMAAS